LVEASGSSSDDKLAEKVESTIIATTDKVESTESSDKKDTDKKDTDKKDTDKKDTDKKESTETPALTEKLNKKLESNKALNHNIAHASVTGKGLLIYYKSQKEHENKEPSGIINLKDAKVESTAGGFQIKTSIRDYIFTTQKKDKWIKSINKKIEEASSLESVEHQEKYKDAYKKLDSGTAYSKNVSDAEILSSGPSDDDGQKTSYDNKRKTLTSFLFKSSPPIITETTDIAGTEDANKSQSPIKPRGFFSSFARRNTDKEDAITTTNVEESTTVTTVEAIKETKETETGEKHDESEDDKTNDATAAPSSSFLNKIASTVSNAASAVATTVTSFTATEETHADKKEEEEDHSNC